MTAPDWTRATRQQCAKAVLVAGVAAQVAAWAAHALAFAVLVAGAITLTAGSLLAGRIGHRPSMPTVLRGVALCCTAGVAWKVILHPSPDALRTTIAPLVVVLQCAHALMATSVREWKTSLRISGALILVAAGVADGATVAVPLVVAEAVLIAGLVMVRRQGLLDGVEVVGVPMSADGRGSRRAISPWGMVAGASLAATVAGLVVFLVVPTSPALGLRSKLAGHAAFPTAPADSRTSLGVTAYVDQRQLSLDLRGELPDTPLLVVPQNSPRLWRAMSYSTYDGQSWTPPTHPITDSPVTGTPFSGHARMIGSGGVAASAYAPGHIVRLDTTDDVFRDQAGDFSLQSPTSTPVAYVVKAVVPVTDPAVLAAARGTDPPDTEWTALPATLPTRIAALARHIVAEAGDRAAQVAAIERWLRTHMTYNLNSPVPRPGEDAVDDFLFRDRTGFCEQFASAETVLLRTLGVPARLVTGLAGGVPGSTPATRVFRASDAHAWVEVYYPGTGWSPSDPTAGAQLANASSRWSLTAIWQDIVRAVGGRAPLAGCLLGLVLIAVVGLRVSRRFRPRLHLLPAGWRRSSRRRSPVVGAFERMQHRLATPRRADETPREYADRVGLTAHLAGALDVLEAECYGAGEPPEELVQTAAAAFATAGE